MSSLYARATPRQARVLRIVEGAVRNASDAHPAKRIDDRMARSIAKRAAGTLTAAWSVLAAQGRQPLAPSDSRKGQPLNHSGTRDDNFPTSAREGAPAVGTRRTLTVLHREIGELAGEAKRSGNSERYAALVDALRMVVRQMEEDPDP